MTAATLLDFDPGLDLLQENGSILPTTITLSPPATNRRVIQYADWQRGRYTHSRSYEFCQIEVESLFFSQNLADLGVIVGRRDAEQLVEATADLA